MSPPRGFTLIEIIIALAIVAIIASIAYPSYRQHVVQTRQTEAMMALVENAHFMERWYAENGTYKNGGSTNWPTLPISSTSAFVIDFSTTAKNTDEGEYRIKAVAKAGEEWLSERYLTINESGNIEKCKTAALPKKDCEPW
ncbi:type IV pilus assembly protein PilE [Crenobacter luteus]|uniref:type IV pilin protein n=1 Tax=Crenobacter luteus TaxID=1452487 RepID=UPI00104AF768|nr:type IV pilin protein [Crenobacter luteus]TCP12980.1 type IV pilus assembly protein PilE [Crenobacter luteus]